MTDVQALRSLAEKIARRLFTNGSAERAQRLVLTIDKPVERNLGGWSEGAATDHIFAALKAAALAPPAARNTGGEPICPACVLKDPRIRLCHVHAPPAEPSGWRDSRGFVLPKFVAVVRREGGGFVLEGHTAKQDWELTLNATGNVESFDFFSEKQGASAPPTEPDPRVEAIRARLARGVTSFTADDVRALLATRDRRQG